MAKSHQLADQIVASIGALHYRHGQRLPSERELAEQFGTARNTVRRALSMVQTEHRLVRSTGRGGYVVDFQAPGVSAGTIPFSVGEPGPSDILEVRLINEPAAAAIAAVRATKSDLDSLTRAVERILEAKVLAEREAADADFHMALFRATRNPVLIALCETINATRRREDWIEGKRRILSDDQIRVFDQQHFNIVAAVRGRDAEAARAAMRLHINSLRREMLGDMML